MDLDKYYYQKRAVTRLMRDPSHAASVFYTESAGRLRLFSRRELHSSVPYLVDDLQLCCLIGRIPSEVDVPNSCSPAKVRPLGERGKIGVPHIVSYNDRDYIIKVSRIKGLRMRYSDTPPSSITELAPYIVDMKSCLYKDLDMGYLSSDDFTNETVIAFLLEDMYNRMDPGSGIGIIRHIGATICNLHGSNDGINLMEYADIGTIRSMVSKTKYTQLANITLPEMGFQQKIFTTQVIKSIIGQVVANLDFLQTTADFNHGDLKVDNVLVKSSPTTIRYKGLSLDSDFSVKIADFGKSSMTLRYGPTVRIFNRNPLANKYLWVAPFKPTIGQLGEDTYYIVDSFVTAQIYAQSRHMGIPFYLSFDTYTFMMSLLSIPEAYYAMFSNAALTNILEKMFFRDDLATIVERLNRTMNKGTFSITDSIKILKGIKLKCRATQIILKAVAEV